MLVTSYVLAFIAVATGAPSFQPRSEIDLVEQVALTPTERGLTWTPRSVALRKNSGNSYNDFGSSFVRSSFIETEEIIILALQDEVFIEEQLQLEIDFSQAIQEELRLREQFQFALDNIRKNTFRNQNRNVNIIIVIITEIIDNRDSSNSNKRYMSRQIQSNAEIEEQIFIVIQESSQVTIGSNAPSKTKASAKASGTSTPSTGKYSPGQALSAQQGISIYPSGVAVPNFSNGKSSSDPAIIIQENQDVFVGIGGDSSSFEAEVDVQTGVSESN